MKIDKSCGARTFPEHAGSLAAAQGTRICEPSWAATERIVQSGAPVPRGGNEETPPAPALQVWDEDEDGAGALKRGVWQGEGHSAPCIPRPSVAGRGILGPGLAAAP